jgi:hypothetical protein
MSETHDYSAKGTVTPLGEDENIRCTAIGEAGLLEWAELVNPGCPKKRR